MSQRSARRSLLDRSKRTSGLRSPTYRGEAVHYRKDLGTSLDDPSYELASLDYNKRVEEMVNSGEAERVNVYDGENYMNTFYLPPDSASTYASDVNRLKGFAEKRDDGYYVDIKGNKDSLYNPIEKADKESRESFSSDLYDALQAQREDKMSLLDSGIGITKSEINRQYEAVGTLISDNKDKMNTVKNKYKQRLSNIKNTIQAMFEGME